MQNKELAGHIAGFITILIWGTTFISTKVLLKVFTPIEILFIRFVIGYLALWLVKPKRFKRTDKKQEWYFVFAGLCGVTLYYLFENIALTYTFASNVGVIISIAPFFTAIFASIFLHDSHLDKRFFAGFLLAMVGIYLISSPNTGLKINPLGDLLAVIAAVIWAIYSTLTRKIADFGYHTVLSTRHIFFYGLLFMLPVIAIMGMQVEIKDLYDATMLSNLMFLGFGASALCFVTWNFAVKKLGSVKTSVYIYMVPVITALTSALFLHEEINVNTIMGIVFTLSGLLLSEKRKKRNDVV